VAVRYRQVLRGADAVAVVVEEVWRVPLVIGAACFAP
jgi:hypothetical protein